MKTSLSLCCKKTFGFSCYSKKQKMKKLVRLYDQGMQRFREEISVENLIKSVRETQMLVKKIIDP